MVPIRPHTPSDTTSQAAVDRRRAPRRPVPDIFVLLGGPQSESPKWAANAVDICEDGIAVAMTRDVEVGSEVLITFRLGDRSFERLPAVVLRRDPEIGVGALRFREWPPHEQRSLAACLA